MRIDTGNIDIVFNELDALVNIDFTTWQIKENKTQLDFIPIGTSGIIQQNLPIDSFLLSTSAMGVEGLLNFYESLNRDEKPRWNLSSVICWNGIRPTWLIQMELCVKNLVQIMCNLI